MTGDFAVQPDALAGRPVVVMTAAEFHEDVPPGWRPEWSAEYMRIWNLMQDSLALVSPDAERIIVPGSTHNIHWDAPEAVIAAVNALVERVRAAEPALPAEARPAR